MPVITERRLNLYSTALLVLYAVLVARFVFESCTVELRVCDFGQYWTAGRLALEGRAADAYNRDILHAEEQRYLGHGFPNLHYNYPPIFTVLLLPFSLLPYTFSLVSFLALTTALYCRVAVAATNHPLACRLALAFPAVILNISYGQNGLLSASLLGGGLILLDTAPSWAGILLGLQFFKPNLALVPPLLLLLTGRWRALRATVLTTFALFTVSLLTFGTAPWTAFVERLPAVFEFTEQHPFILYRYGTIFGMCKQLGLDSTTSGSIHACCAATTLFMTLWLWRKPGTDPSYNRAALICCCLLVTPYALEYDLALFGPILAFYWAGNRQQPLGSFERLLIIGTYVIPFAGMHVAVATDLVTPPLFAGALFACLFFRSVAQAEGQSFVA